MKRIIANSRLIAVAISFLGLCAGAAGVNLIPNGGFEGGTPSAAGSPASFIYLPGGGWKSEGSAGWTRKGSMFTVTSPDGGDAAGLKVNSRIFNTFVAPCAGTYKITYYYITKGNNQQNLALTSYVDDVKVVGPTTVGNWGNWMSVSGTIDLEAGKHIFAIEGTKGSGASDAASAAVDCVSVTQESALTDRLQIESLPVSVVETTPPTGTLTELAPGTAKTCTAPAVVNGDGFVAKCLGWTAYRLDGESLDWAQTARSDDSNKTTCPYVHGETSGRVVWQWEIRTPLAPKVTGGGSVKTDSTNPAFGELVGCEAVPSAGYAFDHWEGATVPSGSERNKSFSFVAGATAADITAVFVAVAGEAQDLAYVGADDGAWEEPSNWSPAKVPTILDAVTILGKRVLCAGGVLRAKSVTVSGSGASLTVGDNAVDLDVAVDGDFCLAEGGVATFKAGRTEGVVPTDWWSSAALLFAKAGATAVRIGGELKVGAGSTLFPLNDPWTGTPIFLQVGDFTLESGGTVDAVGGGFGYFSIPSSGWMPVGAITGCKGTSPYSYDTSNYSYAFARGIGDNVGARHGGKDAMDNKSGTATRIVDATGGTQTFTYNSANMPVYGYLTAPFLPGSPQGCIKGSGKPGGGCVCIFASRTAAVDGVIHADATGWDKCNSCSGASGGSVWIAAKTLAVGATAEVTARGGLPHNVKTNKTYGGGGRIAFVEKATQAELGLLATGETPAGLAVEESLPEGWGTVNANGGDGNPASTVAGTIFHVTAVDRPLPDPKKPSRGLMLIFDSAD